MRFFITVAWRNVWRHRRRSLITAGAMSVAVALCMAMIAFSDGMYALMFDVMVKQQLGHVRVHHPDYPARKQMYDTIAEVDDVLAAVDGLPSTGGATVRLDGFGLMGGPNKSAGAQVMGILPQRHDAVTGLAERVVTGSYLGDGTGSVLLGDELAADLEVDIGDEVVVVIPASDGSIGNALFTVTGLVHTGSKAVDTAGAFVALSDLQELIVMDDQVHQLVLLARDERRIEAYVEEVKATLDGRDLLIQPWWEASPQTAQMMEMQDVGAVMLLGVVFLVAAFGVVNTMLMSVFERTRELGVLRAIGLRPWRLVVLVVVESVMLAGVAGAMGLAMGGVLDWYLVVHGIDFSSSLEGGFDFQGMTFDPVMKGIVRPDRIVMIAVALLVVAALASLWPAYRAATLRPVESLRAE